jgi:hypothetical protein
MEPLAMDLLHVAGVVGISARSDNTSCFAHRSRKREEKKARKQQQKQKRASHDVQLKELSPG